MVERHRRAALVLTGMVSLAAVAAMASMYKLVPDALWASIANIGIVVPATIYIIGLWHRSVMLRKSTDAYLEAGLDKSDVDTYTSGKMLTILHTEPALYAAILHYSKLQRFNGYIMCDAAAPAFVGLDFSEATGKYMVGLVEDLLPALEMGTPMERRSLVARTAISARQHGAAATAAYFRALGPESGLTALDNGLALEYFQALAS